MAFQLPNYPGDNEGLFVFSKTNKRINKNLFIEIYEIYYKSPGYRTKRVGTLIPIIER